MPFKLTYTGQNARCAVANPDKILPGQLYKNRSAVSSTPQYVLLYKSFNKASIKAILIEKGDEWYFRESSWAIREIESVIALGTLEYVGNFDNLIDVLKSLE